MLARAALRYYKATNAMVVLGVAVAVAVLAGALLVGASVRESLRQLALGRLGATEVIVTAPTFFRAALADDLNEAAPMIAFAGAVAHDESKRSAGRVMVYGIDERFGRFHGVEGLTLEGREALISPALASELGAKDGDGVTLRIAKPTDIPLSTLQGRKEITGERVRLTVKRVLDRASLAEFSLSPSQGPVLAIYVSMSRLQRDLSLGDRVNTLLVNGVGTLFDRKNFLGNQLKTAVTLDDLGLRTRTGPSDDTIVESRAGFIANDLAQQVAEIARRDSRDVREVLTYVANAIRIGDREIPYSTVSAVEPVAAMLSEKESRPLYLNEWAAQDLGAKVGDTVTLDYFLWSDEDGLQTGSSQFTFVGVVPMNGMGGDQTLTPEYPGISDAADMTSWEVVE